MPPIYAGDVNALMQAELASRQMASNELAQNLAGMRQGAQLLRASRQQDLANKMALDHQRLIAEQNARDFGLRALQLDQGDRRLDLDEQFRRDQLAEQSDARRRYDEIRIRQLNDMAEQRADRAEAIAEYRKERTRLQEQALQDAKDKEARIAADADLRRQASIEARILDDVEQGVEFNEYSPEDIDALSSSLQIPDSQTRAKVLKRRALGLRKEQDRQLSAVADEVNALLEGSTQKYRDISDKQKTGDYGFWRNILPGGEEALTEAGMNKKVEGAKQTLVTERTGPKVQSLLKGTGGRLRWNEKTLKYELAPESPRQPGSTASALPETALNSPSAAVDQGLGNGMTSADMNFINRRVLELKREGNLTPGQAMAAAMADWRRLRVDHGMPLPPRTAVMDSVMPEFDAEIFNEPMVPSAMERGVPFDWNGGELPYGGQSWTSEDWSALE